MMKMTGEKRLRTAIGYLRVSTAEQGKGTSLETQIESIKNLCMSKNILLVNFYVDKFSGKDFKRPEFEKAFMYLRQNKGDIDLFLTKKIDRFTRDSRTGLNAKYDIQNLGIEVNYVDDWMDDINSPQGEMITTIKMAVATYERDVINERARLGENQAMRTGRYIKTPPSGYSRGKLSNGKKGIVINEKAPLIKALFEDYTTGLYSQIELVKKYRHNGLSISKSSISRILETDIYTGFINLKKHKISPYTLIKGLHQPIISEELFYKAQEIKNGKNRMIKTIRPKNSNFPLSGFMNCSCCGKAMYGSTSNNGKSKKITREYSFYRCSDNCKKQSYKPELVHDELLKSFSKVKASKGVAKLYETILIDEYENYLSQHKGILLSVENKIQETENNQLSLVEKYATGKIQEEFFDKLMYKMTSELTDLKIEKSKYSNYEDDLTNYVSFGLSILTNLDVFYVNATIDIKIQLLGSYFTEKLVFDKNKFRTLPFNEIILLLCKYNKDFGGLKKEMGVSFTTNSHSVLGTGLEPVRPLQSLDFKSSVSTNFTTQAVFFYDFNLNKID